MLAWVWTRWQDGVTSVEADWYALCISYRWAGDARSRVKALPDFDGYDPLAPNDRPLIEFAHRLLSEADIAVAHNGDRFDTRKMNARFVYHGLGPCRPYQPVDTLKIARRHFMFSSNKLGDLGEHLGLGAKVPTGGFDLWAGCMAGEPRAWATMKRYARQDVDLLEAVYGRLLPWATSHPNLGTYDEHAGCPKCGSGDYTRNGHHRTKTGRYQQYICKACGGWFRDRQADPELVRPRFTH